MNVLGIDVGGSGIKAAVVNTQTGELLTERNRIVTPQPSTPEAIAEVIKAQVEHFQWTGIIGCGFPAVVQNGVVKTAANIDNSNIGRNFEQLIFETTGCHAFVINDADAAGIAEARFGDAADKNGLILLLTIGTGIGSALIHNGVLVSNTEFGHLILDNGKTAERFAADSVRTQKNLSFEDWGKRLDKYLQTVERLVYPDYIILGGGISRDLKKYSEQFTIETPVIAAKLKNLAGIIGAALFAEYKHTTIEKSSI